jgi:hypothetical protein
MIAYMMSNPDAPLSREEFATLKNLAGGPQATAVEQGHLANLSGLGLIERLDMEWHITPSGLTRLRKGTP